MDIKELLNNVIKSGASDLHLVPNSEAKFRIDGSLVSFGQTIFDANSIKMMCLSLLKDSQIQKLDNDGEVDFSIDVDGVGRFRGNLYYVSNGALAAAFRVIPTKIPSLDELNCPLVFKNLVKKQRGLILVTGPTGSGKSTTLAALLNEINLTQKKHIITIEDPIEFIHINKNSIFSHRNVGTDTKTFSSALKSALREDPDVILVGELRDVQSMSIAMSAAETGHLVFATVHTNSAVSTINRIIDSFNDGEQPQIRSMLSVSLLCVISQSLIPKIGGGRFVAYEIMVNNNAIANLIRENKIHQIYSHLQLNQSQTGMITQTQSLQNAVSNGLITKDDAFRYSVNLPELESRIGSL